MKLVTEGVVEIQVSCGVTVNIGNYESQRYDLSLTTRVPETVDIEDAATVTHQILSDVFDKEGKKIHVKMNDFLEGLSK